MFLLYSAFNEANTLQKITVSVVPTEKCKDAYAEKMEGNTQKINIYLDKNICAGGQEGIKNCVMTKKNR